MKMSRSFSKVFEEFLRKESLNASLEIGAVENEAADTTNDNEIVNMLLNNETVTEIIETVHMEFNNEPVNEGMEDNNDDTRLVKESIDACVLEKSDNMSADAEAKNENMSVDAKAKNDNMSADVEQKNQSIGADMENKVVNVKTDGHLAIFSRDLDMNRINMIDSANPIEDEKETSINYETSSVNSDEIENTPPDISIYINPYYKSPNLGKTNKLKGISTDNLTHSDVIESRKSSMKLVNYDSSSGESQGCSQNTISTFSNSQKTVKEKGLPSFSDESQILLAFEVQGVQEIFPSEFNYKIRKGKLKNINQETYLDDGSMVETYLDDGSMVETYLDDGSMVETYLDDGSMVDEFQDGAVNVSSSAREAISMMDNNVPIETSANVDSVGRDLNSLRSTPLPLPFVKNKTKQTLSEHFVGTQSSSPLTLSPSSVISSSATVILSSSPESLFSSPEIPSSFPVNPASPAVNRSSPVNQSSPPVSQSSPLEKEASSPVNISLSPVEVLSQRDEIVVYSADFTVIRRVKGTRLCLRKCKRRKANSPMESKSVSEEAKDDSKEAKDESEEGKDDGEVYDDFFSASQDDEELELFSKSQ